MDSKTCHLSDYYEQWDLVYPVLGLQKYFIGCSHGKTTKPFHFPPPVLWFTMFHIFELIFIIQLATPSGTIDFVS